MQCRTVVRTAWHDMRSSQRNRVEVRARAEQGACRRRFVAGDKFRISWRNTKLNRRGLS